MNIDTPKSKGSKPRSRAASKRKAATPSDPPFVTNPGIVAGAAIGLATSSLRDGWIAVPPFLADKPRLHVVSLSGGISSAATAERVIARYGKENVRLWFADTSAEHPDLYRLLDFVEQRFGVPVIRYCDGRDPYEVAEDRGIIPNSKIAPCTAILKIAPCVKYVEQLLTDGYAVTMHIGYNWTEPNRKPATLKNWNSIGVDVAFDLIDHEPIELRTNEQIARGWGIEIPTLYKLGFGHNNCHGTCVKQGIVDWVRCLRYFPEVFSKREAWETRQRQKPGRENYAICREEVNGVRMGLPLAEIRRRVESGLIFSGNRWKQAPASAAMELPQTEQMDNITCVCDAGDIAPVLESRLSTLSAAPDAPQAPASPALADDGYLPSDVAFVVSWYLAHPEYIQRAVDEALNPPTTEPDDQSVAAPILDLVPHVLSAAMWRDATIQAPGATVSAPIRVMMERWEAIPSDVFDRTEIFSLDPKVEAKRESTEEDRIHLVARMLERQGIARAFCVMALNVEAVAA